MMIAFGANPALALRAKLGLTLILGGIALAICVALPVTFFADDFRPFFAAMALCIAGGAVSAVNFWHDICFSPRWRRP